MLHGYAAKLLLYALQASAAASSSARVLRHQRVHVNGGKLRGLHGVHRLDECLVVHLPLRGPQPSCKIGVGGYGTVHHRSGSLAGQAGAGAGAAAPAAGGVPHAPAAPPALTQWGAGAVRVEVDGGGRERLPLLRHQLLLQGAHTAARRQHSSCCSRPGLAQACWQVPWAPGACCSSTGLAQAPTPASRTPPLRPRAPAPQSQPPTAPAP